MASRQRAARTFPPAFVLVDGNPLEDVAAAAKISGVLVRGRWIDRKAIDETMGKLSDAVNVAVR